MFKKYRFFAAAICLITLLGVNGCSTRSLVVRGTRVNLLNQSCTNEPISIPRKNVTIEITKWGPEYLVQTGYKATEYSSLNAAIAATGPSGNAVHESSWTDAKRLAAALKKMGYLLVDVAPEYQIEGRHGRPGYKYVDIDPAYSIEGTYPMGLGPNMAPLIVWDIIMG